MRVHPVAYRRHKLLRTSAEQQVEQQGERCYQNGRRDKRQRRD